MSHNPEQPGGTGNTMDLDETLVKERFDTAVGAISPDVVSLVGGGLAAGRGIRRKRRLLGVAGMTAAAAVVVGTLTVGGVGHLFDSKGTDPAHRGGTLTQFEPATPRGMAAAVMSHTSGVGTRSGVGGFPLDKRSTGYSSMQGGLMVEVGYKTDSGVKVELQVVASPKTKKVESDGLCAGIGHGATCRQVTLPDGSTLAVFESSNRLPTDGTKPSRAHYLAVGVLRADQYVVAIESVVNSGDTPFGVADLQAIATDPAVGLRTTSAYNAQGDQIADFVADPNAMAGDSSSSSGGRVAPPSAQGSASASPPSAQGSDSASPPSAVQRPSGPGSSSATSSAPR